MTDRPLRLTDPSTDDDETLYSITVDPTGEALFGVIVNEELMRVQLIAWPDGENAVTLHTMALPDPDEQALQAAYDRAIEALPQTLTLSYIAYDDQLMDNQIQAAFEGTPPYEDAHFDEWESDMRHSGTWHAIEEYVDDDDLELLRKDQGRMDDLTLAIEERDDSDLFGNLARNTQHRWLRYSLGLDVNSAWSADSDEIEQDLQNIAEELGLEQTPENVALLRELVTEAGGGVLNILWYGEVAELIDAAQRDDDVKQTITWENPHLLILDSWNGAGHEVRFPGSISLPFKRERLKLDARGVGNGYSWSDEIAGMSGDRGTTTATITENTNPEDSQ